MMLALGIPPRSIESRPRMPVLTKSFSFMTISFFTAQTSREFFAQRLRREDFQFLCQQQPPSTTLQQAAEALKAAFTLRICWSQDSVKLYSLRGVGAFDELVAFQTIEHTTHDDGFIANEPRDLIGAGKSYTVAEQECQYVQLTEMGNAQPL